MSAKKKTSVIHFMGLLAMPYSSITDLKLQHGFSIKSMKGDDLVSLLSELESQKKSEIEYMLANTYPCICHYSEECYYIYKEIPFSYSDITLVSDPVNTFVTEEFVPYLGPLLTLMRVFAKGHIGMPLQYYYILGNGRPRKYRKDIWNEVYTEGRYTVTHKNIGSLQEFIDNTKYPFPDFIEMAVNNLVISYYIEFEGVIFLTLMSGMEALFNQGSDNISYTIARCTAVLLGESFEECEEIFTNMKSLYSKRSKVIHKGTDKKIDYGDIEMLRDYLRETIKRAYDLGFDKKELFRYLNSKGYIEKDDDR